MLAYSSIPTSRLSGTSQVHRPWPVSRPDEAEFPPAAQTALELLDWTFRGLRAVDCASLDALRPQSNWFITEDYYEISIPREKLTASSVVGDPAGGSICATIARYRRLPQKRAFGRKSRPSSEAPIARTDRPRPSRNGAPAARNGAPGPARVSRKPESVEVTTPRLYVGNCPSKRRRATCSSSSTASAQVQNAEVVTYKHNQRSKGFAFVQMQTVEEAKRAVGGIARQGIPRPQARGERREIERASLSRINSQLLREPGDQAASGCRSPGFFCNATCQVAPWREQAGTRAILETNVISSSGRPRAVNPKSRPMSRSAAARRSSARMRSRFIAVSISDSEAGRVDTGESAAPFDRRMPLERRNERGKISRRWRSRAIRDIQRAEESWLSSSAEADFTSRR